MSTAKKSGLGKGFDALIPQNFDKSIIFDDQERIQKLAIEDLQANPNQPRQHFDKAALEQLAESIKNHGVLQPLVVSPSSAGKYLIIAGERRWRASQLAGLKKVPAIVRTTKELEQLEIAIVENVQRVDLSPLEQAVSIERLYQQFNMTYESIAKRLGKATSTVNNIVRLLQLPEAAREALHAQKISEGHARAILALKDLPQKQTELLKSIIKHDWSVRQAERFVVSVKEGYKETKETKKRMQTETPATKQLSKRIGAPVHIRRMAKGGKLEIAFKDDEQLEKVLKGLHVAGRPDA
ncbi:MAG TPA: ParB/RepB/Spo0J family partition protein [Candidatus Saccharimonadales bacterium]|nr:ParB/RepB/Spo0J family partition protein [Candidatus Saccharimonadales bacterium]